MRRCRIRDRIPPLRYRLSKRPQHCHWFRTNNKFIHAFEDKKFSEAA
ncbi:Hypothetical protein ETEE_3285 [Edwardsiella anguillarum ET080813]|uniref:Uncharacterized protein n=1 Tax=Edwardsiella anguillarum ET080813 TaxID=667120 RepID=A0A076LW35_9GAMM|nr:Hypothetical protein ETEE_3285 [Edwardsiella anguillarum ET080813]